MPIDLNRFIATFFDEAQEHLETIEERAMALGASNRDPETLNAIFRAAHSIKGGSGTFGFTQLSEATHEMETLFDALRKGKGVADEGTVRLLLDACDIFKAHLAKLKAGERGTDIAMTEVRRQLAGYRAREKAETTVIKAAPVAPAATEESFFTDEAPAAAAAPAASKGSAYGLFDEPAAPAPAARRRRPRRTRSTASSSPPRAASSTTAAAATSRRSA